ncbi:MAG: hypothetical protein WA982_03785 [Rubrobacteraceae bacterium]
MSEVRILPGPLLCEWLSRYSENVEGPTNSGVLRCTFDRPETLYLLVCAYVPASRKAELAGLLNAGAEVPFSEEAVEEHVVLAALEEDGKPSSGNL